MHSSPQSSWSVVVVVVGVCEIAKPYAKPYHCKNHSYFIVLKTNEHFMHLRVPSVRETHFLHSIVFTCALHLLYRIPIYCYCSVPSQHHSKILFWRFCKCHNRMDWLLLMLLLLSKQNEWVLGKVTTGRKVLKCIGGGVCVCVLKSTEFYNQKLPNTIKTCGCVCVCCRMQMLFRWWWWRSAVSDG